MMWIAGLVIDIDSQVLSPWSVEFGSFSHYLRQFLCVQVVGSPDFSLASVCHTSAGRQAHRRPENGNNPQSEVVKSPDQ